MSRAARTRMSGFVAAIAVTALVLSGCSLLFPESDNEPSDASTDSSSPTAPSATATRSATAMPTPSPTAAESDDADSSEPDTDPPSSYRPGSDGGNSSGSGGSEHSGGGGDEDTPAGPVTPTRPDDSTEDDVIDTASFPKIETAELTGLDYPDVQLTLTQDQIENGDGPPLALSADDFTCDPVDPVCGSFSMPAWTESLGFPQNDYVAARGQVQLVDLDGDGWPEIFGVGDKYAEIWTYNSDFSNFVPFQDGDMAAFFAVFGHDATLIDEATGTREQRAGWLRSSTSDGVASMRVGDFDGDGRQEIAARTPGYPGTVQLIDWDPAAEQMSMTAIDTQATWTDGEMLAADVTGDGRDDYVIAQEAGGKATVVSWTTARAASEIRTASPRTTSLHGPLAASSIVGEPDRLVASAYDRFVSYRLESGQWIESGLTTAGSIPDIAGINRSNVRTLQAIDLDADGHEEYVAQLRADTSGSPYEDRTAYVVARTNAGGTEQSWVAEGVNVYSPPAEFSGGYLDGMLIADLDSDGVFELIAPGLTKSQTIAPMITQLSLTSTHRSLEVFEMSDLGDRYDDEAWMMANAWVTDTGDDLLIAAHDTGMRIMRYDGKTLVKQTTPFIEWEAIEQVAYEEISRAVTGRTVSGSADLRSALSETEQAPTYRKDLTELTYAEMPAGVDRGAFERVRLQLRDEFAIVETAAVYFHVRQNVYKSAYLESQDLGGAAIRAIENTQRAQYKTHNDSVALVEGVIGAVGSVVDAATMGTSQFGTKAIEEIIKTAKLGVQVTKTTVNAMDVVGEISGIETSLVAPLDEVRRSTPETTYDVAAVEVATQLADALTRGEAAFGSSTAAIVSDYGLMQAVNHTIKVGYWTMTEKQKATMGSKIKRDLDLYTFAMIVPAVADAYSCVYGSGSWGLTPPTCVAGSAKQNMPPAGRIDWVGGHIRVHLAWKADVEADADRYAWNWGWTVGTALNDKLFGDRKGGSRGSCATAWESACSFNLGYGEVFAGASVPVSCFGLRPNTLPATGWGYRERYGDACFSP